MAALNFPEATVNGQVFEADTGVIYTYIGTPPFGYWSGFTQDAGSNTLNALYVEKNDKGTKQTITGGGGLDLASTIQLNSLNGSAEFKGNIKLGNTSSTINDGGIELNQDLGQIDIIKASADSGYYLTGVQSNGSGGVVTRFNIEANGSATFADTIYSGGPNIFTGADLGSAIGYEGNAGFCCGSTSSAIRVYTQGNSTPTVDIKGNGGAEFANYIWCKKYAPNRIFIGDGTGGKQYAFYSTAGDGSTLNIGLGLDGSATFAGKVQCGGNTADLTRPEGAVLQPYGLLQLASGALDKASIVIYEPGDNAPKVTIKSDGSAEFGGNITTTYTGNQNSFQATGSMNSGAAHFRSNATNNGSASNYHLYCDAADGKVVSISTSGSAVLAADVTCSGLVSNRAGGTDEAFSGRLNGSTKSSIKADGTAEFQSYVTSRRAAGGGVAAAVCALNSSSGSYSTVGTTYGIVTEQTSGTGCFLGANGNAKFGGNIIAGSVTTDRIASNSSGSKPDESPIITIYRQGISTSNPGVEIYTNRIYTSGTVTATNTVFNLDPDNDANYVSTTDAEGNESRVYNGPTLDVKERLTKADNALQTLKTAAAAAVDFAELKAAIATALADI